MCADSSQNTDMLKNYVVSFSIFVENSFGEGGKGQVQDTWNLTWT